MKSKTPALDSIAINHAARKYNKVSAIVLKPDAAVDFGRMIPIKPGSLKEGLFDGFVTCQVTIRAEDIESLYLPPAERLS